VCIHLWHACAGTCVSVLCVCVCVDFPSSLCILVSSYSVSDSFVRSELGNGRSIFVFTVDPIPWRFKDRSM